MDKPGTSSGSRKSGELLVRILPHRGGGYLYGCEVDHIISLKHGGASEPDNLAYACAPCNRAKGSDIGSISTGGEFIRFFNPRTDSWAEHFGLKGGTIQQLTTIGEVTAHILGFNDSARLHEREEMIRFGKYPSEAASAIMAK